jgi:hypothetical protein
MVDGPWLVECEALQHFQSAIPDEQHEASAISQAFQFAGHVADMKVAA